MSKWPAGQLIHWRWSSLIDVCKSLLARERALRSCWSLRALQNDASDRAEEESDKRQKVPDANVFQESDQAVKSAWFWSYTRFLYLVNGQLDEISRWTEACSCHGWDVKCPLRGRRCHEIADGTFMTFLSESLQKTRVAFLAAAAGLSDEQIADLSSELAGAHDLILTEATLKTAHWQILPWHLAAIASDDEIKARMAACKCLRMWELTSPEEKAKIIESGVGVAHGLTRRFLDTAPGRQYATA